MTPARPRSAAVPAGTRPRPGSGVASAGGPDPGSPPRAAPLRGRNRWRSSRRALNVLEGVRRRLGGGQLLFHEREPGVPEAGVGEVDADDRGQVLRAARAAGREQLEVPRDERLPLLDVTPVD